MNQNEVRLIAHGQFGGCSGYHVDLGGFTQEQHELFLGATLGTQWFTLREGQPIFVPVYVGLPDPIEDPRMHPHWRPCASGVQLPLKQIEVCFDGLSLRMAFSPSFYISGLCAYDYTPEGYEVQAQILESFGFGRMRSKRGLDGKFNEVWYLPGVWAAEGDLRDFAESIKDSIPKASVDADYGPYIRKVCGFLCERVKLGSLDVVVQRAAAVLED